MKAVLVGGGRQVCPGVYLIEAGTEAIGHVTDDKLDEAFADFHYMTTMWRLDRWVIEVVMGCCLSCRYVIFRVAAMTLGGLGSIRHRILGRRMLVRDVRRRIPGRQIFRLNNFTILC